MVKETHTFALSNGVTLFWKFTFEREEVCEERLKINLPPPFK